MVAVQPHHLGNWYTGVSGMHNHRPKCCVPFQYETHAAACQSYMSSRGMTLASVLLLQLHLFAHVPGGTHCAGAIQLQVPLCSAGRGGNGTQRGGLPARQSRTKGALCRALQNARLQQLHQTTKRAYA